MACWDLLSNLSLSFSLSYPLFSFLVTACVYDFQGLRVPFPAAAGAGRVDHGRVQCQNQQEGVPFSKIYRVESWIIGSFIFEMILRWRWLCFYILFVCRLGRTRRGWRCCPRAPNWSPGSLFGGRCRWTSRSSIRRRTCRWRRPLSTCRPPWWPKMGCHWSTTWLTSGLLCQTLIITCRVRDRIW